MKRVGWLFFCCFTAGAQTLPITGVEVPEMALFDRLVPALLAKYKAPGASVAVMRDGRLVFARGYGYADVENKIPVEPDSLFRLASVSKPITALAVMKLAEEGRLNLDAKVLDLLSDLTPAPNQTVNPQFRNVTVRQLLWHAGGWDRDKTPGGYDPMFQNSAVTQALGVASPATCTDVIRWMLGRPMDFAPGQKYAYSNFGYCILGRVIEKAAGQPYETYLQQRILLPSGIGKMWIGSSRQEGRKPNEVKYYPYEGQPLSPSVFPDGPRQVPAMYGAWDLRALDSHGGWIASAIDLMRLMRAVDNAGGTPLLKRESVAQIIARPPAPIAQPDAPTWYGFGFQVRAAANDGNWWHSGSLPGTSTLLVRAGQNRTTWAFLVNFRDQQSQIGAEMDTLVWTALNGSTLPAHDLFSRYPSAPALSTNVSRLEFGPPYEAQSLAVTSTDGIQDFEVTSSGGEWLRVAAGPGRTPAALQVSVSPAGMAEGAYEGSIRIAGMGGNPSLVQVNVTMTVTGVPVITSIRNAASGMDGPIAPDSLARITGGNLEETTLRTDDQTAVAVDGEGRFVVPPHLAPGAVVRFTASRPDGRAGLREVSIEKTAPGVFSGSVADGVVTLLATGIRNQPDLTAYSLTMGEKALEILEMTPHPETPGVDLLRARLPEGAAGEVELVLTVDGRASNAVKVATGLE